MMAMEQAGLMTEGLTGRDLLTECRRGNRSAMQSLFAEHQKRVYSVALNFFGGNESAAQDITQQVFLKMFTRIEAFRGDSEFTTWIYRITVNACVDETRKLRRLLSFGDWMGGREPARRPTQDDRVHRNEITGEVQLALKTLKPRFRVPLLLKYVEGLSYYEIAEVLDCSVGTVSSRIHRGHKLLAGKLEHLRDEI